MKKESPFRFETFTRNDRIYVRFINVSGEVFATRSTGCTTKGEASAVIASFLQELDLAAINAAHREKRTKEHQADDKQAQQSIAAFVLWFWSPNSDYIEDRLKAGSPLSGKHVSNCLLYAKRHIAKFPTFQKTAIKDIHFRAVDTFFRTLSKAGESRHIINKTLDALRTPISWATARGICKAVNFGGLVLPALIDNERGILTDTEVAKILTLPVAVIWRAKDSGAVHIDARPRPRLAGGKKHAGPSPVDIRMKAFVLLGLFAGLRRGEERGLLWESIDLENGEMVIKDNFQDADGMKGPKGKSSGRVPIAPELEPVLWELREAARTLGIDNPKDFVLMNPTDPSRPVAMSTLRRGWIRILEMIGIDDAERRMRHLVPHGTRHRFATKLLDAGFTPSEAGKLTRQKTQAVVEKYGAHLTSETVSRARKALQLEMPEGGKDKK